MIPDLNSGLPSYHRPRPINAQESMHEWGTIIYGHDTILCFFDAIPRINDALAAWLEFVPGEDKLGIAFVLEHEMKSFIGMQETKATAHAIAMRLSGACNAHLQQRREDERKRRQDELDRLKYGHY